MLYTVFLLLGVVAVRRGGDTPPTSLGSRSTSVSAGAR